MANLSQNRRQRLRRAVIAASLPFSVSVTLLAVMCGPLPACAQDNPAGGTETVDPALRQRQLVDAAREIRNPLLSEADESEFTQYYRQFQSVLREGTSETNRAQMDLLRKGLRYRVFRLSLPEVLDSPSATRRAVDDLVRDLASAGNRIGNDDERRRFRMLVNQEVLVFLRELLRNHLNARTLAIVRIGELHADRTPTSVTYYIPLHSELLNVLNDTEQPDAVKLVAAYYLGHFIREGKPEPRIQMDIAQVLIRELQRQHTSDAYQMAVIDAVASVTAPRQVVGTPDPIVITALAQTLGDQSRSLVVRAWSAAGVSRCGTDSRINQDPFALKALQLAIEIALDANRRMRSEHTVAAYAVWTAFYPPDPRLMDPLNPTAFTNRAPQSEVVTTAAGLLGDIVQPLLEATPGRPARMNLGALNKAAAFLKDHAGDSMQYDAGQPPLDPPIPNAPAADAAADGA